MFDTLGVAINGLGTRIYIILLEDRQRRWMSDSQNSLREFYKTDVIPMSASLSKKLKELKEELIVEVHEMLNIFESMEQKVNGKSSKENILQNEIDRLLEVSLTSEIRDCALLSVEKQKNEMLKDKLAKSSSDSKDIQDNLLKRIKILENDFKRSQAQIKATRTQHKKELDELIEHVNRNTYAYVDVRDQNQYLLITISEIKNKLKIVDKEKNVNTKFEKSEASGTLLCVIPLPKNIAIKAKKVSNSKVNANRLKPVTSHPTPTNEQGVESPKSVRRQKSKDTKSKNRVLKNTNAKSSTAHVRKMSRSVGIDSNKNSNVKRALFTTPVVAKSKNLGATSVVAKSRLSVANTPKATNKVFSASSLSHDSSQSKTLSNYMKNKIATSQKCQRWFEYQQSFNWSPKSKTAQSLSSETKSRIRVRSTSNTPVTTQKWVAKLSTLPSAFVSCDAGKSKKASLPLKLVPSTESKLELLHMDLCGPMRVASINGKKYILVIVDDYSRYTWVYFLRTKDKASDMIIGIVHQTSIARTPQQNGVVERRNRTLVKVARTMLIFSKAPEFLWAKAIATACFTQNRSIVHTRYNMTPYELIRG
ncbi:retrovirus-related pol polyprotein from transposon TNT 1-94 [Tanacetum coccineum]